MSGLRELLRPYVSHPGKAKNGTPVAERLARFIDYRDDDGCWLWMGSRDKCGYGSVRIAGKHRGVHRVVYELLVGPIPVGMELDHQCHNRDAGCVAGNGCPHRACCNPAHVEVVTHRTNTLRGNTTPALHARVTHCPYGHAYEGDNLYIGPRGNRTCRACRREIDRRRRPRPRKQAA